MIEEEDMIMTTSDVNAQIPEGTRGLVHQVSVSHPRSYLVEFMDEDDTTIDIIEVDEGIIELESKTGGRVYLSVGRRP
jgi:hypothetical protein